MVFEDGLAFEQLYQLEVDCFTSAATGVPGDNVEAALILRRAGKSDLLKLVHAGLIQVIGSVDGDVDEVGDLEFQSA